MLQKLLGNCIATDIVFINMSIQQILPTTYTQQNHWDLSGGVQADDIGTKSRAI